MKAQFDLSDRPICPISGANMKPWLLVPGDWLRAKDESFQLYWCEESQYGCLFPKPSAAQIAHLYDYEGYYTHTSASTKSNWENGRRSPKRQSVEAKSGSIDAI